MKDTTILLIDNAFKDIEKFIEIFKKGNISIIVSVTVAKAKSMLAYIVPDLIVSEVALGEESGYDILSYVRNRGDYKDVPFIFLTSESNIKEKIRALAFGVEDYFSKPYSSQELRIRLQKIIKKLNVKRFDIDRKIFSSTSNLSLLEIIQLLEKTQKSGIFTVFSDYQVGIFHFEDGNIVSGKFGDYTGEESVYKLLETENAIYEFEFKSKEIAATKTDSAVHSIILEGLKGIDDVGGLKKVIKERVSDKPERFVEIENAIYEFDFKDEYHNRQIVETTHSLILEGLKRIDESGGFKKVYSKKPPSPDKYQVFCIGFKRDQLIHLFDEGGYDVTAIADPKDAFVMLDKFIPDLLILNPKMPTMNGFKFLSIISNSPITYHIPVVFIGASESEEEKILALKEGAADYILPPITKYEFDTKIKRIIKESILKKEEYSNLLRGSLNNISVIEIIQGMQGLEKTCMVTFYNGDDNCVLFFDNGNLTNANIKHSESEEAVFKILTWSRGYFEIKFKDYKLPKKINTSTFHLVLEGISKSHEKEKEEVDKTINTLAKKSMKKPIDSLINMGLYNFMLQTAKLDLSEEFVLNTIKVGTLEKFLKDPDAQKILFVDLNLVEKESLEELLSQKKLLYEKIQNGLVAVCFTSRPEIYNVYGVLSKFSWLANYNETININESLSDQIIIKTSVDFFEFNEIKDRMYYTASFPHGFGSPNYKPILFSTDDVPVALYRRIDDGFVFLVPQAQSKEEFINFFAKKIITKINKIIKR